MSDLYRRSIEIILANQAPSGAYIASPNFATYRYCWFRDGSYIAYAMDLTANRDSAARFHAWAAGTVNARRQVVSRALDKAQRGLPLADEDILHTRYTLDGQDGRQEEWPNFQLDGFGTWLWALEQHARLAGQICPANGFKRPGWWRNIYPRCGGCPVSIAGKSSPIRYIPPRWLRSTAGWRLTRA